ncbi:MAG: hypothetical protein IKK13_03860, partial [Clostridia bacterium]|nr:hypothetical protein [Clostridia bacterium]
MKKSFSRKLLSVILAFAMILSCATVAFSASAEGEVKYKVVIDSTSDDLDLVDGQVDADGYTLKVIEFNRTGNNSSDTAPGATAINAAISKYIELFGENTDAVIYISGTVFTWNFPATSNPHPFANTGKLNSLKFEGYTGKDADWFYMEDSEKNNGLQCDLTFDNIKVSPVSGGDGLYSNGNTITLGKNVNASFTSVSVHPSFIHGDQRVVFNAGTYNRIHVLDNQNKGAGPFNMSAEYVFNGGTFNAIKTVDFENVPVENRVLNGNVKYVFNGGTFNDYIFVASGTTSKAVGNTIFEVNGGNFAKANSDVRVFNYQPGGAITGSGNAAIILNDHNTPDRTITVYDNSQIGYAEGKKEIVVINNFESGKFGFDYTLCSDYLLKVTGGKAYPVFSETENVADSVLLGFEITYGNAAANDSYTPYIGETSLAPYYNEETGLYDLSSFEVSGGMKNATALNVSFKFTGTTKVVIDTTGELAGLSDTIVDGTMLKVISTTAYTGNYVNDSAPHRDAIKNAITAVKAIESKNPTIYVNGNLYTYEYPAAFAGASSFETLTIEGYNGTEDIFTFEDSEKVWTSCDTVFDNITLRSKAGAMDAMLSNKFTVTFGEGVSTSSSIYIGGEKAFSQNQVNNIVINGGGYKSIGTITSGNIGSSTVGDIKISANYKFNNGVFNGNIYAGVYEANNNSGGNWAIDGNVYFEFNGGVYNQVVNPNSAGSQPILGNTVFVVNGGTYNLWDTEKDVRDPRSFNIQPGPRGGTIEGNGNIAIIINGWADAENNQTNIYNSGTVIAAEGKKFVGIINNAEVADQGFDEASMSVNPIDYMLKTYGGKTYPVFSETANAADSVLLGFTITASEGNEGKLVVVNGTDIIEAVDGLYDLSAYED